MTGKPRSRSRIRISSGTRTARKPLVQSRTPMRKSADATTFPATENARRDHGTPRIPPPRRKRVAFTTSAPDSIAATNFGMSAGSLVKSLSMKMTNAAPSSAARSAPLRSAAP